MAIIEPVPIAKRRLTEEEFMRLPDDGRKYELVDGEPKEVSTSWTHDIIGGNIYDAIKPVARGRGFMSMGQAGFRMTDGNIRCPDISYTSRNRITDGVPAQNEFGAQAPDLCIEVISPSEEPGDMRRKLAEYFDAGASQVWHVFPETKTVRVYTSPAKFDVYTEPDEIEIGDLLPGLRLRVAEIFEIE